MAEAEVAAVLEDWRTAPVNGRMRAALGFLEIVTKRPDQVTPEDSRRAVEAGVSKEALREAVYVAFLFNTLNRISDTLGFETPSPRQASLISWAIRWMGYRMKLPG